jgi:hypothetical protein
MRHSQADLEAALQQIVHAEDRIEEQREYLARLRRSEQPTDCAEDLLRVLLRCRVLLQKHLATITNRSQAGNFFTSLRDTDQ